MKDLFKLFTVIWLLEVNCKCQWNHIVDVQIFLLTISLHVEKELVFRCKRLMSFYVVYKLFVAESAQTFIVYIVRCWFPFEVEQVRRVRLLPSREVLS